MLIYGIKKIKLGNSYPSFPTCIHCKKKGMMQLEFKSHYFHFFWIPIFPYRKKSIAKCTYCNKETNKKDFSEPLSRAYYDLKNEIKSPLWQYSGLFILLSLVLFIFYQDNRLEKNRISYFNNPKINDVYKLKLTNGNYTTFKVKNIYTDSLLITFNSKETNKILHVYKIDDIPNYQNKPSKIAKKQLKYWFETDTIYGINRN